MADAPSPHGLNSAHHTGTLADAQAPQFLMADGSRDLTGNLAVSSGVTVDGVDISVLYNNYQTHLGNPLAHNYIRNLLDDSDVAAPKGVTTNDVKIYGDGTDITVTKTASGLLISYIGSGGGGGGGSFSGIKDPAGTGVAPDGLGWILTTDDNVVNLTASGANTLAFSIVQGNITHNNLGGLTTGDPHTQYPLLTGTETISGLWTFSRSTNPPFAVNSGAGKVANLDADKLDGLDSTAFLSPQYLTLATNSNLSNERVLVAGSGLTLTDGGAGGNATLAVGAGTLITVGATTVGIAAGTNYQFIGTGSGTAAGWRNVSELAGAGLTAATGILAVGAGAGLTVNADDVALATPGSVTVSSANSSSGNHTHAVVSSSNPGSAASLLATDASGRLNLAVLGVGGLPSGSDKFNVTGHATLDSADFDGAVTIDDDLTVVYGGYSPLHVYVNTSTPQNSNVGIMPQNLPGGVADSQFALDVGGPIRGEVMVGPHAIQLEDAEMIVHFDGPRPYETDFSGFSTGHMGQVGTESGGVIYRPGKFGKAVQVAEATTNLLENPSFETNTNYWNVYDNDVKNQVAGGYVGSYSCQLYDTASSTAYLYKSNTPAGWGVAVSDNVTFSAYVKGVGALVGTNITLSIREDGNNLLRTNTTVALTDDWQRVIVTRTLTTVASSMNLIIQTGSATSATDYVLIDAVQLEKYAYATPYCDGSLGSGHSWSGTAHASTSSRTGATLRYANSLDVEIGTIALWVWHESNTTAGMGLFGTGANTQFDAYVNSAGAVFFRMAGVNLNSSANVVMRQWNHYAFTWSKADNSRKIYLNGVEVASRQYDAGAIMGATLYALSLTAGSGYTINGYGDEFVHLRRAANANEIRAIYESNAPVFAESSVFSFRAPTRSPVWVDEEGLWMRSYSGNDTFGIYAADATKSWGGLTLYDSDLAIGNSTAGYVHWHSGVDVDDATYYGNPLLEVAGRMHVKNNSTFDGTISIGTSGGIYQGTGSFGSPTTGLKIWNDSGVGRIAGYNAGTEQWYANTDGKLYAGAGNVVLDEGGLEIKANPTSAFAAVSSVAWKSSWGAYDVANIWVSDDNSLIFGGFQVQSTSGRNADIYITSAAPTGKTAKLTLEQKVNGVGNSITIDGNGITLGGTVTNNSMLTVDNLRLDGNTLSSTSGAVTVQPLAGQNLNVSLSTTGDFAVNTNQLVVDTSAGRVGVNTSSPSYALDVTGNGRFSSDLSLTNGRLRGTGETIWLMGTGPSAVLATDSTNFRVGIGVDVLTPAYTLDVAGTARLTQHLRLSETGTTPSGITSSAEGVIYVKGDKLVIAFNDAGTTRYKYLDLTGTGVTWVHTTTAP